MITKRKLKAEVVRLTYRVEELEERLCPCEQHDWVRTGEILVWNHPTDPDFEYEYKCRHCGKCVGLACDYKDRMVSFGIHRTGDAAPQEEA